MENRVSVVSIIVKNEEAAVLVNELLHEFRNYIVGRMGLPYRDRGISIISVVLDAPGDISSSLSGKLGMLEGVSAKTLWREKDSAHAWDSFLCRQAVPSELGTCGSSLICAGNSAGPHSSSYI